MIKPTKRYYCTSCETLVLNKTGKCPECGDTGWFEGYKPRISASCQRIKDLWDPILRRLPKEKNNV